MYTQLIIISRCHLGKVIVYDTITRLGWSSNINNHGIKTVIDKILSIDWDPDMPVPEAVLQEDCVVRSFLDFCEVYLSKFTLGLL